MTNRFSRFEELYSKSIDPWEFRTSQYEKEKYAATVAALPKAKYQCGVEAGCSIGELSRLLAVRAETFFGIDVSQTAINEARTRNADRPNLKFTQAELPAGWPDVRADLIVLSEFLYFLTEAEIEDLAGRIVSSWMARGDCIIVSYLGDTSEPLQGEESAKLMVSALSACTTIRVLSAATAEGYRIDVLRNDV